MDRLPGSTLNELTYRRPEILEEHKVSIAYQLGMHMVFSYVFGAKDGYQTNYVFDPVSRILTRIDKESFFEVPVDPKGTLSEGDDYTQEIAACELSNLKYIPSYRRTETRHLILFAFRQGFLDKYGDIKSKSEELLSMVAETRATWLDIKPVEDLEEYGSETRHIHTAIEYLIQQDPERVFDRLLKAKAEVDTGKYSKK